MSFEPLFAVALTFEHLHISVVVRMFTDLLQSAGTVPAASGTQVTFDLIVLLFVFVMTTLVICFFASFVLRFQTGKCCF